MTQAFLWSTRPNDDEPARILQDHGLELAAASVLDHVHAPFEQRGGVYGTARQILSFLRDPDIARWVTSSGTADRRRQLDLAAFVQSRETLYLHSKEGQGSSAGLVTALAMALCDAAEQLAKRSPGGRLAVPLVGVLDEAANICRWRQLPDLYSHYGSRGIPLLTLLQSWSQGAQVWGQTGMRKLWGASNVRVYGGGSAEEEFLSDLEKLIGEYNRLVASPSSQRAPGGGSSSTSWQLTPTPILTVADLAALPRDRIIVMPSGAPPVLAEPVYWWNTRQAAEIRESIATHDPPAVLARRHAPQPTQEAARGRHRREQRRAAGRYRIRSPAPGRWWSRPSAACSSSTSRRSPARRSTAAQPGLLDSERIEQLAVQAAERQLAELADPPGLYYLTARGVGARVAVPGVPPLRARPRPCVVPAVVATRRGRRAPGVAVAGVGAPAPGRRDRPVGLVSRPRRPSHDDPARRRRPVQRLRRPPLRPSRRRAAARPATRGHVRTRRDPAPSHGGWTRERSSASSERWAAT